MGEGTRVSGSFGVLLRDLRQRAGLTQEELACRAGLTMHAVSALERGVRRRPYPHTVRALADALDLDKDQRTRLLASVPLRPAAPLATSGAKGSAVGAARRVPGPETALDTSRARRSASESLQVPPTPLRGRDDDLRALVSLLHQGHRVLTLTGPGGVGKTRLAAALADSVADRFRDGVVALSLAAVGEASSVIAAIARAVGAPPGDGPAALSALQTQLRETQLLLVVDNLEHLLSAAIDLGRLVASCPDLTLLCTSRSPLRIRGEQEYTVEPLRLPRAQVRTIAELSASPAGALLLDRLRAVAPKAQLTGDQIQALGELCQRLAGLPLALELVANHLRLQQPQELLTRLDEILDEEAARDLPTRQRTLRASLDWSYQLLAPDAQFLFRLLGVFRGGASLEDLERVAERSGFPGSAHIIGVLAELVAHSMVVVRPDATGGVRYSQLEPIAQYSRSLLVGDEAARAARAHAHHFREVTELAARKYRGVEQIEWLARIEADEPNIVLAVDRALDLGDVETAVEIVWSMWLYWWLRGQVRPGLRRVESCLAADPPAPLRARALTAAGTLYYAAGDRLTARDHWSSALSLALEEDEVAVAVHASAGLGLVAVSQRDLPAAERHFRDSVKMCANPLDDLRWWSSLCHVFLGTALLLQGRTEESVAAAETGLALAREGGDRLATYVALHTLSQAAIVAGRLSRAREYLEEGIELSAETLDLAKLARFCETLAVVDSADGRYERVPVLLGAAVALQDTVGNDIYGYYVPDEAHRSLAEKAAQDALGRVAYDDGYAYGAGLDVRGILAFASSQGCTGAPDLGAQAPGPGTADACE